MAKLVLLVGLPGSGKSTFAYNYWLNSDTTLWFSSDNLRKELYGNEEDRDSAHTKAVFAEMERRAEKGLKDGMTVIYDATNVWRKNRIALLNRLREKGIKFQATCVLFCIPYEICVERDAKRSRKVGAEAIRRIERSFEIPLKSEGWDEILFCQEIDKLKDYTSIYNEMQNFDQDNSHHNLTLGAHCARVKENLIEKTFDPITVSAGAFHDVGKLYTKTYFNMKGRPTEQAHYFGHENVGSYEVLTLNIPLNIEEKVLVSELIGAHMVFYHGDKSIDRIKNLLGEEQWNRLLLIHEADGAAH